MIRSVSFPDRASVPALGQGAGRMGEDARLRKQEIASLRAGVDLGMTLIDTAEMYGDGATESLLGDALAGLRDQVFLVSKVYPQNAGRGRIERASEGSLQRLKTDHRVQIQRLAAAYPVRVVPRLQVDHDWAASIACPLDISPRGRRRPRSTMAAPAERGP